MAAPALEVVTDAVKVEIDDRRGVEGKHLAEEQPAGDGHAQGPAQLGTHTGAEGQRQRAKQGCHGGHEDRTEAQHAGLEDGVARVLAVFAFGDQGEVDHHDGVLLHDSYEQKNADDGDNVEFAMKEDERNDGAYAGGGQRSENGDGVHQALIQHAKHNVDGEQRGNDQQRFGGERLLKGLGGACEGAAHGRGNTDALLHLVDQPGCLAQRDPRREIEGDRHRGKERRVIDGQGRSGGRGVGEGIERNDAAVGGVHIGGLEGRGLTRNCGAA